VIKLRKFSKYLSDNPKIKTTSLMISIIYGLLYYYSIGLVRFNNSSSFKFISVTNFLEKSLNIRAPFLWEAGARINLGFLEIDISIVNVLIAIVLGLLVFLNIALLIVSIKMPKMCRIDKKSYKILSLIPAFFSGFACCAPTIVIMWVAVFGSVSTTLLTFFRWALPFSIILLAFGAYKGISTLKFNV
jgi:hypothetical protein